MLKINLHLYLCLLLIFNYFRNGATVNYNPYDNNKQQHHLLPATNSANDGYNAQQSAFNVNTVYHQPSLQGNSNYQQLHPYYYTPPYQQQQQQQHPSQAQQSTQFWSGPPIVVEEADIQEQQRQSTTNIPPTFYQQDSTGSIKSSSELLPFFSRQSKVLMPAVYSPQPTTQAYFTSNNNNNNNIIYHRDFRHEIYAIPKTEHTRQEDNMLSWNNQQQQNQLLEQQQTQQKYQPQQFYSSDTTLSYNGISNNLLAASSLRKADVPDYRKHFKQYLENNPRRIKPIY